QVALGLEIQSAADDAVGMINRLEWIRKQLADLEELARSGQVDAEVAEAADELAERAVAVEGGFVNVHLADGLRDFHQAETRIFEKLGFLGADVI
ncbi:MAG: hypothetical protein GWM92_04075, partial [Gemmatimonadetes bacterium]|nr:hypothetical protein [Gemmatimonadota bacterium]NIR77730.1 hypothetical protein [Gemmatimonadota bacterium]NIT86270.1 hypothetical protein [Gemmatimonadota bacterium]NIU30100.1 hypothetical protein [Gemmatimonadota bacterium]NIU35046.1 hypothetical protein [Gemmatimonadota bacterium]